MLSVHAYDHRASANGVVVTAASNLYFVYATGYAYMVVIVLNYVGW